MATTEKELDWSSAREGVATSHAGTDLQSTLETAASDLTAPSPKKPTRKTSGILPKVCVSLAALSGMVGTYLWFEHATSVEETDDAYIAGHVHQISARVGGYVTKVAVDDNDHVQAGQLVVQVDPRDYLLKAESAKAEALKARWQATEARSNILTNLRQADSQKLQAISAVASASAQIHQAQEALNDAKLGVALAQTSIQQRQAELTRANADYERYRILLADRAVTTQSFEKAKQDKEVGQANLEAAKAIYNQAIVKVKESQQSLLDTQTTAIKARGTQASAQAAIAQTDASKDIVSVQKAAADAAEIQYQDALTQLSYTKVLAPTAGTIGHKTVEVGQQIEKGQALMSIVSDDKWIVANFKETQLGRMHVGQEAEIKVDRIPNKTFKGHVQSMSPASGAQFSMLPPDNASGNFTKVVQRIPVKIIFERESLKGSEGLLSPGMSVVTTVHLTK